MDTNLFYLLVVLLAFLFAIFAQPTPNSKVNKFWLATSFCVLFFVLGFRNASGIDDPAYIQIFETVNSIGVIRYWALSFLEPGYLLLNSIVGSFTNNYFVLQAIAAFIPLLYFYKGFDKYSNIIYIPLCVLLLCSSLYFQMLSTSLIRMFIAISLVFYFSMDYILKQDTKRYIISILLISMFHYSAMIMMAFVPITFSDKFIKRYWVMLTIFLGSVLVGMFSVVTKLAGVVGGRYGQYSEVEGTGFSLGDLDTLPFVLMAIFYIKIVNEKFRINFIRLIIILIFSIICTIWSGLGRVIFYMNLSMLFLLPYLYRVSKYKLIIGVLIVTYVIMYIIVTQLTQEAKLDHLYPYQNIFFNI